MKKYTITEHLKTINQNGQASIREIKMLVNRIRGKFRANGFHRTADNDNLIMEYIYMIFETQDYRCTFWLEAGENEINGVWNSPKKSGWATKNIYYEVDHVNPINAGGSDSLTNFQFLSQNANHFTKCSLTMDQVLKRVDLSEKLKDRLRQVMKKRNELFNSDRWKDYTTRVKAFEQNQEV